MQINFLSEGNGKIFGKKIQMSGLILKMKYPEKREEECLIDSTDPTGAMRFFI